MNDGTEAEAAPGQMVYIEPDHDLWVVGDTRCVFVDFQGFAEYAKRA